MMTPTFNVRAAVGAREVTRAPSRMATPGRPMKYFDDRGEWVVVRPGVDHFEKFTLVWNAFHPRGREALRLQRELADIESRLGGPSGHGNRTPSSISLALAVAVSRALAPAEQQVEASLPHQAQLVTGTRSSRSGQGRAAHAGQPSSIAATSRPPACAEAMQLLP
jgi:hypothetical protein